MSDDDSEARSAHQHDRRGGRRTRGAGGRQAARPVRRSRPRRPADHRPDRERSAPGPPPERSGGRRTRRGTGRDPAGDDGRAAARRTRRKFLLHYIWFRRDSALHNTAVAVAWIGFAGAVAGPLVAVAVPALLTQLTDRSRQVHQHRTATIINPPGGVTYAFEAPSLGSRHSRKRATYREGDTIEVVCQLRDGEPVTMPGDGRPLHAVSVWDRLPNGSWIPDIFTNLPRKRGPEPPPGIELCPDATSTPAP